MKLLILTICVLVLVALANTKPCSGPRCKRITRNPYGGYDFGDTATNNEDTNEEENNGSYVRPKGGIRNENTPKPIRYRGYRRGYDYSHSGANNADTNEEESNRWSDCPNCYASDFGKDGANHNTINIENLK